MKKFAVIPLALLLGACGTTPVQYYSGPAKASNEIAIFSLWTVQPSFKGDLLPEDLKVSSVSIDDNKLESNGTIEVLPGHYVWKVKCDYKGDVGYHTYSVNAQAGKNYAAITYVEGEKCTFKSLKLLENEQFVDI